jgi:hypothetical protein
MRSTLSGWRIHGFACCIVSTWLLYAAMAVAGLLLGFAATRVRWRMLDARASNAWLGAVRGVAGSVADAWRA